MTRELALFSPFPSSFFSFILKRRLNVPSIFGSFFFSRSLSSLVLFSSNFSYTQKSATAVCHEFQNDFSHTNVPESPGHFRGQKRDVRPNRKNEMSCDKHEFPPYRSREAKRAKRRLFSEPRKISLGAAVALPLCKQGSRSRDSCFVFNHRGPTSTPIQLLCLFVSVNGINIFTARTEQARFVFPRTVPRERRGSRRQPVNHKREDISERQEWTIVDVTSRGGKQAANKISRAKQRQAKESGRDGKKGKKM